MIAYKDKTNSSYSDDYRFLFAPPVIQDQYTMSDISCDSLWNAIKGHPIMSGVNYGLVIEKSVSREFKVTIVNSFIFLF